MTIVLDHTIVAVADKRRSAHLFADLIGATPGIPAGPFVPVEVNRELTLDFDERFGARPGHYASSSTTPRSTTRYGARSNSTSNGVLPHGSATAKSTAPTGPAASISATLTALLTSSSPPFNPCCPSGNP